MTSESQLKLSLKLAFLHAGALLKLAFAKRDYLYEMTAEDVGSAHYHLAGHGGFSLMKWEGTHSKIDPLLDEMLRNYPKVDIGKTERTAGK